MYRCSFYVKYGAGKSSCMFTQNLYKASKSLSLSERVCNPCSRKIRNLCKLYVAIKNATSHDKAEVKATTECRATFLGLSLKWLCGSPVDLEFIERGRYII